MMSYFLFNTKQTYFSPFTFYSQPLRNRKGTFIRRNENDFSATSFFASNLFIRRRKKVFHGDPETGLINEKD